MVAVALGNATLSATLNGITGTATYFVTAAALASIEVTPATPNVPVGTAVQLTATGVWSDGSTQNLTSQATWSSSSAAVATVGTASAGTPGLVSAAAAGSTTVTASFMGVSGSTPVTVTAAALTSISVTPAADPPLIQHEPDRRLAAARDADPTKKNEETLQSELKRVVNGIERLLNAYQEQLRDRMPSLQQRERALRSELQAIADQTHDRGTFMRLADTLTSFLAKLRKNADTPDVIERQRIVRLVVKEILVGEDTLAIRHCIPVASRRPGPSGGRRQERQEKVPVKDGSLLRYRGRRVHQRRPAAVRSQRPLDEMKQTLTYCINCMLVAACLRV